MRFHLFCAALSAIILGSFSPVSAQDRPRPQGMSVSIHGEVRYAQGGTPAENVLVVLESFSGGMIAQARTDRGGKFDFSDIAQATYRVTASLEGYQAASQEVNLNTTFTEYVILTLVAKKDNTASTPAPGSEMLVDSKVPKEAIAEFEKGRSAMLNDSDPTKGIPHLERALKIYPAYLQAQLLLGTAYMDAHQVEKAETSLKRVLEIDPKTAQAYLALGEIYRETKRYSDAEKALTEGLKLNDASWQGHFSLGRLYWDMGNVPKSGVEIGRTLQLNPEAAGAYLYAGNLFLKAGKATEALQMFTKYLSLAPKGEYAEQTRNVVRELEKSLAKK